MKRFLLTTALMLCLPAMAAEKKAQPTTELPTGAIPNTVKPAKGGPLISVEESSKMSPAEAQKHANVLTPIAGPLVTTKGQWTAPLGAGQTLAPGQQDVVAVQAPAPPPLPHGPPVGMITAVDGPVPEGWAACEKTHASGQCTALAASQGLKGKMIVKLPESGKIEDLDRFLDAITASKAEAVAK